MAIAKRELLIALINSLDRSEKRFFTTHYQSRDKEGGGKYFRLFQFLTMGRDLADPKVRQGLGVSDASQMANVQRHLYSLILESLRRQHRHRDPVIQVQENLDYAHLLYDRGLYLEALSLLKRAKNQAKVLHLDLHHILILEFEKMIESRHITRSREKRMLDLTEESRQRQGIQDASTRLSNLQLTLQRYFIGNGHIRGMQEARRFHQMFYHNFTGPAFGRATFRERIGRHRALFWYHYCTMQLEEAAGHARSWVEEFSGADSLRLRDVSLYLKGLDRCLTLAYFRQQPGEHRQWFEQLTDFTGALPANRQSRNILRQSQLLHLRARLNQLLLDGKKLTPRIAESVFAAEIRALSGVDRHKKQVLSYKLAALLARSGNYQAALDHLEAILDDRQPLRYDVVVYARLLFLFCHHRLGNNELVGYGINNLARYLGRVKYASSYPKLLLALLRSLQRKLPEKEVMDTFREELAPLLEEPCENREVLYFSLDGLF